MNGLGMLSNPIYTVYYQSIRSLSQQENICSRAFCDMNEKFKIYQCSGRVPKGGWRVGQKLTLVFILFVSVKFDCLNDFVVSQCVQVSSPSQCSVVIMSREVCASKSDLQQTLGFIKNFKVITSLIWQWWHVRHQESRNSLWWEGFTKCEWLWLSSLFLLLLFFLVWQFVQFVQFLHF